MSKKVLLLGYTGKMGIALCDAFKGYDLVCKNSQDFDACDFDAVKAMVVKENPDVVFNTVALVGIDICEDEPQKAYELNTLYPRELASLSTQLGFVLIHFSTESIFCDREDGFYTESDTPKPLHIYGITKYGGDCIVEALAEKYYICRLPLLFGETNRETQFVEKMLKKAESGAVRVSADIYTSPSYSKDIAWEVKGILEEELPFGVYHIVNEGKASLYDVFKEIVENLKLDVTVERASHKEFPSKAIKSVVTPMKSEKIKSLRPWREAIAEYTKSFEERS